MNNLWTITRRPVRWSWWSEPTGPQNQPRVIGGEDIIGQSAARQKIKGWPNFVIAGDGVNVFIAQPDFMEKIYAIVGRWCFPRQQDWEQRRSAKTIVWTVVFTLMLGLALAKILRMIDHQPR